MKFDVLPETVAPIVSLAMDPRTAPGMPAPDDPSKSTLLPAGPLTRLAAANLVSAYLLALQNRSFGSVRGQGEVVESQKVQFEPDVATEVERDSHVLVSAQACFLPIPKEGTAEFNPVLFNYQSTAGDPAVLTILATREGTSVTVIDNQRDAFQAGDTWGQRLFFNENGQRASLTGQRQSDFVATDRDPSPGNKGSSPAGLNMVSLIQVPLKQKSKRTALSDFDCDLQIDYCLAAPDRETELAPSRFGSRSTQHRSLYLTNLVVVVAFPTMSMTPQSSGLSNGSEDPRSLSQTMTSIGLPESTTPDWLADLMPV